MPKTSKAKGCAANLGVYLHPKGGMKHSKGAADISKPKASKVGKRFQRGR